MNFTCLSILFISLACYESSSLKSQLPLAYHEFCTNVGPVSLETRGDSVVGRYQITITSPPIAGVFKGKIEDGLLDAVWSDSDGKGRILFGFASDFSRFTAIYNNERKANHWFEGWSGKDKATSNKWSAEQLQQFRCDWK